MARSSLKLFFVYVHNNTDVRDDNIIKVLARTKGRAKSLVSERERGNVCVGSVMTRKGLKRYDAEWHALLWGVEPEYVED